MFFNAKKLPNNEQLAMNLHFMEIYSTNRASVME